MTPSVQVLAPPSDHMIRNSGNNNATTTMPSSALLSSPQSEDSDERELEGKEQTANGNHHHAASPKQQQHNSNHSPSPRLAAATLSSSTSSSSSPPSHGSSNNTRTRKRTSSLTLPSNISHLMQNVAPQQLQEDPLATVPASANSSSSTLIAPQPPSFYASSVVGYDPSIVGGASLDQTILMSNVVPALYTTGAGAEEAEPPTSLETTAAAVAPSPNRRSIFGGSIQQQLQRDRAAAAHWNDPNVDTYEDEYWNWNSERSRSSQKPATALYQIASTSRDDEPPWPEDLTPPGSPISTWQNQQQQQQSAARKQYPPNNNGGGVLARLAALQPKIPVPPQKKNKDESTTTTPNNGSSVLARLTAPLKQILPLSSSTTTTPASKQPAVAANNGRTNTPLSTNNNNNNIVAGYGSITTDATATTTEPLLQATIVGRTAASKIVSTTDTQVHTNNNEKTTPSRAQQQQQPSAGALDNCGDDDKGGDDYELGLPIATSASSLPPYTSDAVTAPPLSPLTPGSPKNRFRSSSGRRIVSYSKHQQQHHKHHHHHHSKHHHHRRPHETIHAQSLLLGCAFCAIWSPNNLMAPNLTDMAATFEFSEQERDLYLGSYCALAVGVCSLPIAAVIGMLSDVWSRKYLFVVCCLGGAVASFATAYCTTYRQLLVARWWSGGFMSGSVPVAFSFLSDLFAVEERNAASSGLTAMMGLGIIMGQVYAGMMSQPWPHAFVVSAAGTALLGVLCAALVQEPVRGGKEQVLQDMLKAGTSYQRKLTWRGFCHAMQQTESNSILLWQGFFSSLPWGIIFVFLNDYLSQERGFSVPDATFLVLVFGLGCAAGGVLGGYCGQVVQSWDRSYLPLFMAATTALGIVPFLALLNTHFTNAHGMAGLLCSGLGGLVASLPAVNVRPCLINVNPPETRGASLTAANLLIQLGRGVGPSCVTLMGTFWSVDRQFSFNVTLILFWLVSAFQLVLLARSLPKDQDAMETELALYAKAQLAKRRDMFAADSGGGGGDDSAAAAMLLDETSVAGAESIVSIEDRMTSFDGVAARQTLAYVREGIKEFQQEVVCGGKWNPLHTCEAISSSSSEEDLVSSSSPSPGHLTPLEESSANLDAQFASGVSWGQQQQQQQLSPPQQPILPDISSSHDSSSVTGSGTLIDPSDDTGKNEKTEPTETTPLV